MKEARAFNKIAAVFMLIVTLSVFALLFIEKVEAEEKDDVIFSETDEKDDEIREIQESTEENDQLKADIATLRVLAEENQESQAKTEMTSRDKPASKDSVCDESGKSTEGTDHKSTNDLKLLCSADISIPIYTKEDMKQFPIPENEALKFLKKLKAGWNLGNTFDAMDEKNGNRGLAYETYWSHARTSKELIHAIKEAGFNLVRIPVSWHNHISGNNYSIDQKWLNRIHEVAQWIYDEDMYFIINIHHDNSKQYLFPDMDHYEQSERYISLIWKQIADAFSDFDEHCIFESMNEPRLVGSPFEWWFNPNTVECQNAAKCINGLNQIFVDTVRSSGGNNADRYLLVPGYCGSPEGVTNSFFSVPEDTAENRIIIEVHAYRPYDFALNLKSTDSSFVPGKDTEKTNEINAFMNSLYQKFIKNGIPVLIDEFASLDKKNLQDRVNFTAFYTAAASVRGMTCCIWDNHSFTGNGEKLGIIDRNKTEWVFPEIAYAMIENSVAGRGE